MKRLLMTLLAGVLLAGGAFAQDAAAPDVLGEWELTTNSPVGETTNTVEFRKDDDALKAFAKGAQGERPYDSVLGRRSMIWVTKRYDSRSISSPRSATTWTLAAWCRSG